MRRNAHFVFYMLEKQIYANLRMHSECSKNREAFC